MSAVDGAILYYNQQKVTLGGLVLVLKFEGGVAIVKLSNRLSRQIIFRDLKFLASVVGENADLSLSRLGGEVSRTTL